MRGIAVAWLVITALGGPAGAQEKPATAQAEARAHYQEARALHERGEYQRAAAAYLQAFALFPDPELLFNVGQVYRLAGDAALATCELGPCGIDLGGPLYLGHPDARFAGLVDEVRIVDRESGSESLRAEFENLSDPESFYTVGGEEPLSL